MKLLDLDELSRSEYILTMLLVIGDRVTGYTMLDKVFVKALRNPDILRQNIDKLRQGSAVSLLVNIQCSESDTACIERARSLGLEPNKDYEVHVVLAAISTRLLDLDKLRELLEKYFSEVYQGLVVAYGSRDEILEYAQEAVLNLGMLISTEDSDEVHLQRKPDLENVRRRVVLVDSETNIDLVDLG